jgi:long-subunit acyl-CoA synthetase (AMP-forming)
MFYYLLLGYGLSETSPAVLLNNGLETRPAGTTGIVVPNTEIKVL